jgi:hypothetical protein
MALKSMTSGPFFIGTLVGVGYRMKVFGPRLGTVLDTGLRRQCSVVRDYSVNSHSRGIRVEAVFMMKAAKDRRRRHTIAVWDTMTG